ncbi:hypothetical protein BDN71DRAFT_1444553 [Pleurotus eryngii]|uniref:Uncharacterized protein n=1 Tax=Pleurotus eryngii TaxID=5323 RepID=A0A9P6A1U9_PLEER|nr:hypothetical protein BDN71DRAFT_1444553 [Pleurotus eryngii]
MSLPRSPATDTFQPTTPAIGRSTVDIVWSCLALVSSCTWVAMEHPPRLLREHGRMLSIVPWAASATACRAANHMEVDAHRVDALLRPCGGRVWRMVDVDD